MSTEPSERAAREFLSPYFDMLDALAEGQAKMNREVHTAKLADLLTRYASAARLEEAEWWHTRFVSEANYGCCKRIEELRDRAAQQKAPGEG